MGKNKVRKKITTSENSIVKDILSYKFPNSNEEENDLIAKVVIFAINNLEDEYRIDSKLKINIVPGYNRGFAILETLTKRMSLSGRIFESRKGYGEDLIAILHETMHYAQAVGAKNSDTMLSSNKSIFAVNDMASLVISYLHGFGEFRDKNVLAEDKSVSNVYKKIREYSKGKYHLDPSEVEARMFSYDMLEKILDIAKEEGMIKNINQWANYREMEKTLTKLKDSEYRFTRLSSSYVERYDDFFKNIFRDCRRIYFERDENGENAFDRFNSYGKNYNSYILKNHDIVKATLLSLVYDYDEEYAGKLFDEVLKFDNPIFDDFYHSIGNLVLDTNYVPTDSQKERFLDRLDDKDREVYSNVFEIAEKYIVD